MALNKTGACYWRDEAGDLWLAESFEDEATGEVTTTNTLISPPEPTA